MFTKVKLYIIYSLLIIILGQFINGKIQQKRMRERFGHVKEELFEKWKEDGKIERAKVVKEMKDILLEKDKVILKWRTKYWDLEAAIQEEIKEDSIIRYKVSFEREDSCINISGFTLTHPPEFELSYLIKPIKLERELMHIRDNIVYAKFWTDNPCVELEDIKIEISPDITKQIEYKTNWFWTGIAAGIGLIVGLLAN